MKWYFRTLFLLMATGSVVAFRELPGGWNMLMWIPIAIGFGVYYKY